MAQNTVDCSTHTQALHQGRLRSNLRDTYYLVVFKVDGVHRDMLHITAVRLDDRRVRLSVSLSIQYILEFLSLSFDLKNQENTEDSPELRVAYASIKASLIHSLVVDKNELRLDPDKQIMELAKFLNDTEQESNCGPRYTKMKSPNSTKFQTEGSFSLPFKGQLTGFSDEDITISMEDLNPNRRTVNYFQDFNKPVDLVDHVIYIQKHSRGFLARQKFHKLQRNDSIKLFHETLEEGGTPILCVLMKHSHEGLYTLYAYNINQEKYYRTIQIRLQKENARDIFQSSKKIIERCFFDQQTFTVYYQDFVGLGKLSDIPVSKHKESEFAKVSHFVSLYAPQIQKTKENQMFSFFEDQYLVYGKKFVIFEGLSYQFIVSLSHISSTCP
jgi:hypothetical protein